MNYKIFLASIIAQLTFVTGQGQDQSFNAKLEVQYDMYLNFDEPQKYEAVLLANDSISFFNYYSKKKSTETNDENFDQFHSNIFVADTTTYTIITERKKNTLFSLEKNLHEHKKYYTVENIPAFNWTILKDQKNIEGITCYSANLLFRGREYLVWYAPSIPSKFGPWKFSGLPGLILEVNDKYNEVILRAKKIRYINKKVPLSKDSYDIVSLKEHIDIQQKNVSELERKLQSRMSKGINIHVESKISRIELEFNDLQP